MPLHKWLEFYSSFLPFIFHLYIIDGVLIVSSPTIPSLVCPTNPWTKPNKPPLFLLSNHPVWLHCGCVRSQLIYGPPGSPDHQLILWFRLSYHFLCIMSNYHFIFWSTPSQVLVQRSSLDWSCLCPLCLVNNPLPTHQILLGRHGRDGTKRPFTSLLPPSTKA